MSQMAGDELNLQLRRLWFVPIIIAQLFTPLAHISITPLYIYIQHLLFEMCCYWIGILIYIIVQRRFSLKWKKAPLTELRAEDSVLLEGIGVFQGTLFIYLSLSEELVSSSPLLNLLRWSIPLVTMLFFALRAYGAVKNSPKHRHYSSLLLLYYLVFQGSILLGDFISSRFPIYVDSTNLVRLYVPNSIILALVSFLFDIRSALSIRYGYAGK